VEKTKRFFIIELVVTTLVGLALGFSLFFLAPYAKEVFEWIIIGVGALVVVMNIPALVLACKNIRARGEWINLLVALASIALGLAMIIVMLCDKRSETLFILFSIYAVGLPLVRIFLIEERVQQLKHEIWRFVAGLAMTVVYIIDMKVEIMRFFSVLVFVVVGLYLIYSIVAYRVRFSFDPAAASASEDAEASSLVGEEMEAPSDSEPTAEVQSKE
jgi:hypothetical protein